MEDVFFSTKRFIIQLLYDMVESGIESIESIEMHVNPKGIRCCSKYTVLPFV